MSLFPWGWPGGPSSRPGRRAREGGPQQAGCRPAWRQAEAPRGEDTRGHTRLRRLGELPSPHRHPPPHLAAREPGGRRPNPQLQRRLPRPRAPRHNVIISEDVTQIPTRGRELPGGGLIGTFNHSCPGGPAVCSVSDGFNFQRLRGRRLGSLPLRHGPQFLVCPRASLL